MNGQERRRWLDAQSDRLAENARYYLGPYLWGGVSKAAKVAEMLNPVESVERSMTASREMAKPGKTPMERVGHAGEMLTGVAEVAAPVGAAKFGGSIDDTARAVTEMWTGFNAMPETQAAKHFWADETGAIRAWHGSPHDFDKFSMDKIGTGEGAQAYGHGLYFAENENVARGYQQALAQNGYDNTKNYHRALESGLSAGDFDQFESLARQTVRDPDTLARAFFDWNDSWGALRDDPAEYKNIRDFAADYLGNTNPGRLYEVEIDANPEDFLDWDAPITEAPKSFQEWAGRAMDGADLPEGSRRHRQMHAWRGAPGDWQPSEGQHIPPPRVAEVRNWLANYGEDQARMTDELREAGIPGIRYLDQGSRGTGDGTRNYVVFDDELITILRKMGLAGIAPTAALLSSQQGQQQ